MFQTGPTASQAELADFGAIEAEVTLSNKEALRVIHKLHIVDAVAALYNGEVTPPFVKTQFNVSRTTAELYLKSVPKDLPVDSQTSLQVKRAVINLVFACNYPHRMPYTESEQREALYQVATGTMKCPAALWHYGVPVKTINNHLTKLRASMGFADNEEMRRSCDEPAQRQALLTRCKSLAMTKPGGQPYMNPDLLELFKEIATLHDNSSAGWDQRTLSAKARTIVQGLGEEMLQGAQTEGERKAAQRLISAKCSSHWLEGNILDPEVQVFTKKSDQSHKRTAASNPLLDFVMRTKMDKTPATSRRRTPVPRRSPPLPRRRN